MQNFELRIQISTCLSTNRTYNYFFCKNNQNNFRALPKVLQNFQKLIFNTQYLSCLYLLVLLIWRFLSVPGSWQKVFLWNLKQNKTLDNGFLLMYTVQYMLESLSMKLNGKITWISTVFMASAVLLFATHHKTWIGIRTPMPDPLLKPQRQII
jgi:hypothetical protein